MHFGVWSWPRQLQTECQNGKKRWVKQFWAWHGCWCQKGRSEYFAICLVTGMSIPLWPPCTHPLMAASSRIMQHVTKLESFQIGFLNMTMRTPIEHLWDVVERELHALDVHPTNLHQLQDAILSILKNAFSTLLNQCHVELMQFLRWKGVKHSISMVFLIIL